MKCLQDLILLSKIELITHTKSLSQTNLSKAQRQLYRLRGHAELLFTHPDELDCVFFVAGMGRFRS